ILSKSDPYENFLFQLTSGTEDHIALALHDILKFSNLVCSKFVIILLGYNNKTMFILAKHLQELCIIILFIFLILSQNGSSLVINKNNILSSASYLNFFVFTKIIKNVSMMYDAKQLFNGTSLIALMLREDIYMFFLKQILDVNMCVLMA
ncbi:hypothetical protein ACJX0J_015315, partial [Zea mays]